jgi:hypothetical protein
MIVKEDAVIFVLGNNKLLILPKESKYFEKAGSVIRNFQF